MPFDVAPASPDDPDVAALLDRHFALMRSQSPEESCHVLPIDALKSDGITVFALRDAGQLLAVGAIKLEPEYAELKSMHTSVDARGRGAGAAMVSALLDFARDKGVMRVNLETGSGAEHASARRLYERAGFTECPPFGNYVLDPLSAFMTKTL